MLALRKATVADVPKMHALMAPHIVNEALLPRSERTIVERLRDYTVAESDGQIVGLASVSLVELHLAELGAVVCDQPELMEALVEAALSEARAFGVEKLFVVAPAPEPYEALGFELASIADFPEKRDRQCLRCPRLPRCRQVVLQRAV